MDQAFHQKYLGLSRICRGSGYVSAQNFVNRPVNAQPFRFVFLIYGMQPEDILSKDAHIDPENTHKLCRPKIPLDKHFPHIH